eukprot:3256320-Rhodomonas_salina.8
MDVDNVCSHPPILAYSVSRPSPLLPSPLLPDNPASFARQLNEVQSVMLQVLEAVVVFLGVPVLLRSAWSNMRTKISDLDVNLDGSIETNEKILFLYKAPSSFLSLRPAVLCARPWFSGSRYMVEDEVGFCLRLLFCDDVC